MLIEITKNVKEVVEIKPGYYKGQNFEKYHYINKEGILLTVYGSIITCWQPGKPFYESSVKEAVLEGVEIRPEEFHNAYDQQIKAFNSIAGVAV